MTTSVTTIEPSPHKPKTKVWRTKAQWKALLEAFNSSGLTKSAFCKQHQIATGSLHKWQKHFADQAATTEFIDITAPLAEARSPLTPSKPEGHWQVELELGAGVILRVHTR